MLSRSPRVSDLPDDGLGRPADQVQRARGIRDGRRPGHAPHAGQGRAAHPRDVQRVGVGRAAVEVRAAAARGAGAARRDGAGVLHGDEPQRQRHHRRGHVQRDARAGGALLQQDPVLLLRGAAPQRRRDRRHARLFLPRPGYGQRQEHEGDPRGHAELYLL